MTPEQLREKIQGLIVRHRNVRDRKGKFQRKLDEKKGALAQLVKEVKEAGYDPTNLPAEVEKAKGALIAELTKFETELEAVEKSLAAYESADK